MDNEDNMGEAKNTFLNVLAVFLAVVAIGLYFTRPVVPADNSNIVEDTDNTVENELVLTSKSELKTADAEEVHVTYAPEVPPAITRSDQRFYEVELEVVEGVCDVDPANGVKTETWGYRIAGDEDVTCGTPGPVLRGRVGDVVRITVTNLPGNSHPHNIDFHSVTGQGGGAADLSVAPGETASIDVRLLYPGAFMYHCAYGDVPVHIMRGMYGMFIVDPATPLPEVDHEWAVMQSEWYLGEADENGVSGLDREALKNENPSHVTFNGSTDALTGENALKMKTGERARIYFVNEGLNLSSNFHPIGSHWDLVYPEAATHESNSRIYGSQTTLVPAGGGVVAEFVGQVPSTIILVDHALTRTFYKGAIGLVQVEGPENHEIFEVSRAASDGGSGHDHGDDGHGDDATHDNGDENNGTSEGPHETVVIKKGAWEFDDDASNDYSPNVVTVKVGTTVTWVNNDDQAHTVTSGSVDGYSGTPDGKFDSGFIDPGGSWSYTFTEPGVYTYYCLPHPWMKAKVIVEK